MAVEIIFFLCIDMCNYIWRIEKEIPLVNGIEIGVYLGTIKTIC